MNTSNTQITIDAYNKNAEKYAKKFENYETYRNRIIDFQGKYIPKGDESGLESTSFSTDLNI